MTLRDAEWRLLYAGTDLTFGTPATPVFNRRTPDLGDVDILASEVGRPRSDGQSFGIDYRAGRTIGFDLGVRAESGAAVRDATADLTRAWRADAVRLTPGAVAELQTRYDGRERAVFGRPRRFAADYSDASVNRLVSVTADFVCADDVFYSTTESQQLISLVPPPGGGLIAPLASPMSTTASSDRSMGITVGGELPAWPVIEVTGPITNPVVEVVGLWRMAFTLTLAYDQTLVIDTRPWARTAKRNGASVARSLTRTSARLSKAAIPPGDWEVALRGVSATGTPTARVRWRDTFSAL